MVKSYMLYPLDLAFSVSTYSPEKLQCYGKNLSASVGLRAAQDIFLEHCWDVSALFDASIMLRLTKFLSKNLFFDLIKHFPNFQIFLAHISSFIFLVFLPFGEVI